MKTVCLVAILCGISMHVFAQGLTQSAEGKSTIPIRGAAVGIDLAKAELSLGYNNINRNIQSAKVKPIYGIEVRVKNEEGIGDLFSGGDLVAAGNANIYGGVTFTNSKNKRNVRIKERVKEENAAFKKFEEKFRTDLTAEFTQLINDLTATLPAGIISNRQSALTNALGSAKPVESFYTKINVDDTDPDAERVKRALKEIAKKRFDEYDEEKDAHVERLKDLQKQFSAGNYQRFTVFAFGGISAIQFKKFNKIDSSDFSKGFEDMDDRGGNLGLGVNYQWRNIWLGVTYSYVSSNNFSLLKKNEFTLRKTTTVAPQSLIEESKVTGYAGTFGEVELNNLNADVVIRLPLDKSHKNYLLFNPYLRASIFSRDTSLLPNKTNLGTGYYFIKNNGSFLGGFYLELPDVSNNAEKKKPVAEQNLRSPFKRLSFGIVTKFNLSSIFW